MRKMKAAILTTAIGFLFSGTIFAQAGDAREQAFVAAYDAYIRATLDKLPDVPGIGVAVVKDGKPIFVKAYGYADREAKDKANENTLFYIASSTKSFTALAAALLDSAGSIKLADPLTRYTNEAGVKASIPDKVTVRDLLTHTSGLRNSPLTFRLAFSGDSRPADMNRVFAGATGFDDAAYGKYQYTNLGYNIYGILLQSFLKQRWQDVLQRQIFDPLKMKHTTSQPSLASRKGWHLATGYTLDVGSGKTVRAPIAKTDSNMQSAGGIFASAADLARWLIVNIDDGRIDGKQVFPASVMRAVHTGYTKTTRNTQPFPGDGEYGLGWQIGSYKGDKVLYHPGGFTGYSDDISFMPDKRIGVAVLVNNDLLGGRLDGTFTTYVYDWWNNVADLDLVYQKALAETVDLYPQKVKQMRDAFDQRAKRPWQLTLPRSAYSGSYTNEYWGTIEIVEKGDALQVKMGNIDIVSTPFTSKDSIRVELMPGTGEVIEFTRVGDKITGLRYAGAAFTRTR